MGRSTIDKKQRSSIIPRKTSALTSKFNPDDSYDYDKESQLFREHMEIFSVTSASASINSNMFDSKFRSSGESHSRGNELSKSSNKSKFSMRSWNFKL